MLLWPDDGSRMIREDHVRFCEGPRVQLPRPTHPYGTIIVDLERRTVADVLESRSAKETAEWLKQHPGIEVVSRDRCGLYAQGIRQGAPQARQVADRFHVLQNLRESIERQMTDVSRFAGRAKLPPVPGDRQEALRGARGRARQALSIRVAPTFSPELLRFARA